MKKIICLTVFLVLFLIDQGFAGTVELPRTGQTTCYDSAGNMIACPGSGQDGDVRAGVEWPSPRFAITYCTSDAPCTGQTEDCDGDPSNDVVMDNLTGLMWTRKACNEGAWPVLYWGDAVSYAWNLALCGHDDWRLPNANELESLINAGVADQIDWLGSAGFTDLVQNWYYTSTRAFYDLTYYSYPNFALGLHRGDGAQRLDRVASWGMAPAWPVRAGQSDDSDSNYPANIWKTGQTASESAQEGDDGNLRMGVAWPDPRFTITYCNSSGPCAGQAADCDDDASTDVVTDNLTGLIWARDANRPDGPKSWTDGLNYAKNLTLCGYTDWRLPNRRELHSLTDFSQHAPALPAGHPFTQVVEGVPESYGVMTPRAYWSSTTCGQNPTDGFCVSTYDGSVDRCTKTNAADYYVWPVCGGNTEAGKGLQVSITGARFAEAGGEYSFTLTYSNNLSFDAQDLVVQVYLPSDALYVSSTRNGIYRLANHEVFWKLGAVAAGASGDLAVTVEFAWGIPPHTDEQIIAQIDAANSPRHTIDTLDEYLAYEPAALTATHSLTRAEIKALINSDQKFSRLYQLATGMGFEDYGLAERREVEQGPAETVMQLLKQSPLEVLFIHKAGDLYFIEKYETSAGTVSILDAGGGFSVDLATGSAKGWGSWAGQQSEGLYGAGFLAANCPDEQWRCLLNCMTDKGLIDIFMQLGSAIQTSASASKCYACALGVKEACSGCSMLVLKHMLENSNKLNLSAKKTNDTIECFNDCIRNPGSHYCSGDLPYCPSWAELNWLQKLHVLTSYGAWTAVKVCDPATCTYTHTASFKACGPCVGCNEGACDMFIDMCGPVPEILVGGDPNEKLGQKGNVIAGQQLDYTINYENYGEGTAFGVYVTDELDENVDDSTLVINNGGTYYSSNRLLTWEVGDLRPGAGGSVGFSVRVKDGLASGTEIINQATVYFPSVPEITPTNAVVNVVRDIVAHPQEVEVESGAPLALLLSGAASGGRSLTYKVVSGPYYGELSGTAPALTYTSSENYNGPDRFSFLVSNGASESEPAEIRITVLPSASDAIPPTVVLTNPADDARDIPVSDAAIATDAYPPVISAMFSEPVNPDTVNQTTFTVGGVAGTVGYDVSLRRAFFTPSRPLAPSTTYTATITTGVKDNNGNALAEDHTWQFTTISDVAIEVLLPPPHTTVIDFGAVAPRGASDPKIVTVVSAGLKDLVMGTVSLTGADALLFSIENDTCSGKTLAPGENCTVRVIYTPKSKAVKHATLELPSNDPDTPVAAVPMSGGGSASWLPLYAELFDTPSDLGLMRQYRDSVLARNERGKHLVNSLYANSQGALAVLNAHPELLARAYTLISANLGAVEAVLRGEAGTIRHAAAIMQFLQDFADACPPDLQRLVLETMKQMSDSRQKQQKPASKLFRMFRAPEKETLFFGFRLDE